MRRSTKRPRFSVGGHPVFENEDSSNHSGLGVVDFDENSLSQQNETSTNSSDQQHFPQNQYVPDRSRRFQGRGSTKTSNEDNGNFVACLDHLFNTLSRKDKEGFFQYPVTDQLAPGYSRVISNPMDFSTIRKKINQDEYSNLLEFKADFELICENAMMYNRPETIYWQAAKKLLQTGTKLLSKEKLISLRRNLECFSHLTEREFGFPLDLSANAVDEQTLNGAEAMETSNPPAQRPAKVALRLPRYYEKLPNLLAEEEDEDEFLADEVLAQAQQAAQCSREKLSLRRPASNLVFSCQRQNGTTTLPFLNQIETSQTANQARIITIGELSNLPSSAGAPSASAFLNSTPLVNEIEKRNRLLPRYFLDYGSFSSHAPQFDSSFCSISKDELDLLIHTYGSEFATQNTTPMLDFVQDSGDFALSRLDRMFVSSKKAENNSMINGHIDENGKIPSKTIRTSSMNLGETVESNVNQKESSRNEIRQKFDFKLDENAKLLFELRQAQYDRLTQPPSKVQPTMSNGDTLNEIELAEKVLGNLSEMSQMPIITPERIISSNAIHHNLGIFVSDDS